MSYPSTSSTKEFAPQPLTDNSRRLFWTQLTGLAAGFAAAPFIIGNSSAATARQQVVGNSASPKHSGYRLTAHISDYYNSARR